MTSDVGGRSLIRSPIVVVGPTPPPYHGVSVAIKLVLDELQAKGFHLFHVETRRALSTGGRASATNFSRDVLRVIRLLALRARCRFILYMPIAQTRLGVLRDAVCILLLAPLGVRTVIHLHGAYFRQMFNESPGPLRWLIRRALKKVEAAIVLGESLRGIFSGLVEGNKVHVVPNGMPSEELDRGQFEVLQRNRKDRVGGEPLRVLYLSNLIKSKGYIEVLRAIGECKRRGVPVIGSFAGAWVDSSKGLAEAVLVEEGIADAVTFLGPVVGQPKWELLGKSDVLVLPTYYPYEGQPISIVEAMAFGLPVISTEVGCITDMVRDGENGYLVPPRDPKVIADRICMLYEDPDRRIAMGYRSRELYEKEFTADRMIGRLEAILKAVAASPCQLFPFAPGFGTPN